MENTVLIEKSIALLDGLLANEIQANEADGDDAYNKPWHVIREALRPFIDGK